MEEGTKGSRGTSEGEGMKRDGDEGTQGQRDTGTEDGTQDRFVPGASATPDAACADQFWSVGPEFGSVTVSVVPPESPLALLERLGPSPFERGGFPVVGFLATTYDKVSRYALTRR